MNEKLDEAAWDFLSAKGVYEAARDQYEIAATVLIDRMEEAKVLVVKAKDYAIVKRPWSDSEPFTVYKGCVEVAAEND